MIEYVGEVLSEADCRARLAEQERVRVCFRLIFVMFNLFSCQLGIRSYYFMSLDGDTYLDARLKANMARFINHSCDPNCFTQASLAPSCSLSLPLFSIPLPLFSISMLSPAFPNFHSSSHSYRQKWQVLGETRVGIFAKRDIPRGAELSFDYQVRWSHLF